MSNAAFLIIKSDTSAGDKEFSFLLSHRKDSTFGFPGGKLEYKETPLSAVLRECEEEINFLPTQKELLNIGELTSLEFGNNQIYCFLLSVPMHRLMQIMSNANKMSGSHSIQEACGFTLAHVSEKSVSNLAKLPFSGTAKKELFHLLKVVGIKYDTVDIEGLFSE